MLCTSTSPGVCGGQNATRDCAGQCFGSAIVDDCNVCTGGITGAVFDSCSESCFADTDRCSSSSTCLAVAAAPCDRALCFL